jgi:hypothetical protein
LVFMDIREKHNLPSSLSLLEVTYLQIENNIL